MGNSDVLLNVMMPSNVQESLKDTINGEVTRDSVLGQLQKKKTDISSGVNQKDINMNIMQNKSDKNSPGIQKQGDIISKGGSKDEAKRANESLLKQLKMERDGKTTAKKTVTDEKPSQKPQTMNTNNNSTKYDPVITANMNAPTLTETKTKKLSESPQKKKKTLQRPRVEMEVNKEDNAVELTVHLPGVVGVSECDLEVLPDHLSLTVVDKYELELDLPVVIDVEEAKAKFVKDLSILLITAKVDLSA